MQKKLTLDEGFPRRLEIKTFHFANITYIPHYAQT